MVNLQQFSGSIHFFLRIRTPGTTFGVVISSIEFFINQTTGPGFREYYILFHLNEIT